MLLFSYIFGLIGFQIKSVDMIIKNGCTVQKWSNFIFPSILHLHVQNTILFSFALTAQSHYGQNVMYFYFLFLQWKFPLLLWLLLWDLQWFCPVFVMIVYHQMIWRWSGREKTLWFICIKTVRVKQMNNSRIIKIELICLLKRFNMETSPSGWTNWELKMRDNIHVKFTINRDVCFHLKQVWNQDYLVSEHTMMAKSIGSDKYCVSQSLLLQLLCRWFVLFLGYCVE